MPQDPFPLPPGDAEEPDSSGLPAAAETGPEDDWAGPADDDPGMGQGLYMCLPAGQVTLAGFAQGGQADTMAPSPLLATIIDTVTGEDGAGLAGCSDDQLLGIISAARRMQARAACTELAATAEYAARHDGKKPADEFAPVELSFELHLTPLSAKEQMDYAAAVAGRLPVPLGHQARTTGLGCRRCAVPVRVLCGGVRGRWTGLNVDDDQLGVDSGDVGVIRGKDSVASLGCGQGHVHVDDVWM